jgi:hypothetical protein
MMLTNGTHMPLRGEWDICLRIRLQLGPTRLHTYFVAYLREIKNCNGTFQNTWIVVAFLQLWKIVMAWNQITLLGTSHIFLLNCNDCHHVQQVVWLLGFDQFKTYELAVVRLATFQIGLGMVSTECQTFSYATISCTVCRKYALGS